MIKSLELEQATATFDEQRLLIRVAYRGSLGSEVTVQVYDWIDRLVKTIGVEAVFGEIFDFREVTEFQAENLQTARKTSKRMNVRVDMSNVPVALIIKTFYHEEILRGSMQVVPDHQRKRIVKSEAEALAFIEAWQQTNQNHPFANPSE
jgi:hypothetical protein